MSYSPWQLCVFGGPRGPLSESMARSIVFRMRTKATPPCAVALCDPLATRGESSHGAAGCPFKDSTADFTSKGPRLLTRHRTHLASIFTLLFILHLAASSANCHSGEEACSDLPHRKQAVTITIVRWETWTPYRKRHTDSFNTQHSSTPSDFSAMPFWVNTFPSQ